jgi:hypothetical protein
MIPADTMLAYVTGNLRLLGAWLAAFLWRLRTIAVGISEVAPGWSLRRRSE